MKSYFVIRFAVINAEHFVGTFAGHFNLFQRRFPFLLSSLYSQGCIGTGTVALRGHNFGYKEID
jgi:hypothetical protein